VRGTGGHAESRRATGDDQPVVAIVTSSLAFAQEASAVIASAGCVPAWAGRPHEFLDELARIDPVLVLIEWDEEPLRWFEQYCVAPLASRVPVIVAARQPDALTVARLLEAGADQVLNRYEERTLQVARLRAILRRYGIAPDLGAACERRHR
jgi:DNA-binding response OmpR family regulator